MDDLDRHYARRALGLPNDRRRSCRNHYSTSAESIAFDVWCSFVQRGFAVGPDMAVGIGTAWFFLTVDGANRALDPGETLRPADFPDAAHAVSA